MLQAQILNVLVNSEGERRLFDLTFRVLELSDRTLLYCQLDVPMSSNNHYLPRPHIIFVISGRLERTSKIHPPRVTLARRVIRANITAVRLRLLTLSNSSNFFGLWNTSADCVKESTDSLSNPLVLGEKLWNWWRVFRS